MGGDLRLAHQFRTCALSARACPGARSPVAHTLSPVLRAPPLSLPLHLHIAQQLRNCALGARARTTPAQLHSRSHPPPSPPFLHPKETFLYSQCVKWGYRESLAVLPLDPGAAGGALGGQAGAVRTHAFLYLQAA